jgi:hypothetical protein
MLTVASVSWVATVSVIVAAIALVASSVSAFVATRGLRVANQQALHARRAFVGSNFLSLMNKLQEEHARVARGRLKAHFSRECDYCQPPRGLRRRRASCDGHPLRWAGSGSSPPAVDADHAAQLFDQVGIMLRNDMIDAEPILNNWGVTILEIYIVSLAVVSDRRNWHVNPEHWRSFDELATKAAEDQSVPIWLRDAYFTVIGSARLDGLDATIAESSCLFSVPRSNRQRGSQRV